MRKGLIANVSLICRYVNCLFSAKKLAFLTFLTSGIIISNRWSERDRLSEKKFLYQNSRYQQNLFDKDNIGQNIFQFVYALID